VCADDYDNDHDYHYNDYYNHDYYNDQHYDYDDAGWNRGLWCS
jgi:hypothetical protein